jgi:hypothetical protein
MSVDPIVTLTREPYRYASNNPVNQDDPSGLCGQFGPGPGSCGTWCNPLQEVTEALQRQGEEMKKHHCHNNQVVIEGKCVNTPPIPGGPQVPPERPVEEVPFIPLPIPLPFPAPEPLPIP